MNTATSQIQAVVYARLNGDSTLFNFLGVKGVFDRPPENQPVPYITIGQDVATDASTIGHLGQEVVVELHTWTQLQGRKLSKAIMNRIDELLHHQEMTLTDFYVTAVRRQTEESLEDPDHVTYHGVQRFRVWVYPKP